MNHIVSNLKKVFPLTIPILTGYLVLGAAYGILMDSKGYSVFIVLLSSTFIYAGSMQFLSVSLLASGFHPFYAVFMTLMVNARYLFYGISLLSKFKGTGRLKYYLIYGITDETFSLLCSTNELNDNSPTVATYNGKVDRNSFMLYVTLLNHIYWIVGSLIGYILNSILDFNTMGLDFVLTALFVVIFIDKVREANEYLPFIIGIASSVVCRIIFGSNNFILPTMISILVLVTVFRNKLGGGFES